MPTIYLDCNATTPLDPDVREVFFVSSVGMGSEGLAVTTLETGRRGCPQARNQVVAALGVRAEASSTSGATQSDNLAILGLRSAGREQGKLHVITSAIEHKAVLEPCEALEREGFAVTRLPVDPGGA